MKISFRSLRKRKLFRMFAFLVILLVGLVMGCSLWVVLKTSGRLYDHVENVPPKKVALLLGTASMMPDGRKNLYFLFRIQAAAALYKAGKIKHIIASGDNHIKTYDEATAMKQALMTEGVPENAISLDYAGFRTLDSVVRCKEIFGQTDILVISQEYHNRRALVLCDHYGIQAIGFNAASVRHPHFLRESLARVKMILDLYVFHTQPHFLGEKVALPLG